MVPSGDDRRRYERYVDVASAAVAEGTFTLDQLKAVCSGERPGFVTRVVRQLEKAGLLVRSGPKTRPVFQWERGRQRTFSPADWAENQVLGVKIPRTPKSDRPRERLLVQGPAALRTAELLAILIRSGRPGESALQAAEKLAARFGEQLEKLPQASPVELKAISPALAQTAYCQIMAGIELGRRVAGAAGPAGQQQRRVLGPDDAIALCQHHFARMAEDATQEEFHVVCLNTKHELLATHRISVGGLGSATACPREVFRPAIRDAAAAVLLVHNHPSGDPTPSREDLALTDRLEETGRMLGIDVLDHVVVARRGAVTIREFRRSANAPPP